MDVFNNAMRATHDAIAAREMMIEQLIERGAQTNRSDLDDNIAAYARLNAELPHATRMWRSRMRFQFEDWQRKYRNNNPVVRGCATPLHCKLSLKNECRDGCALPSMVTLYRGNTTAR